MTRTPVYRFAAPLLCAFVFAGCASGPGARESAYAIIPVKGCTTSFEHPDYDPELPGMWLTGAEGLIQMSLKKDAARPEAYRLILTRAGATEAKPMSIGSFAILTAHHRITARFDRAKTAPVIISSYIEKKAGTEIIPVVSDISGDYLRFADEGASVRVTLTGKLLRLLDADMTVSWKENTALTTGDTPEQPAPGEKRRLF